MQGHSMLPATQKTFKPKTSSATTPPSIPDIIVAMCGFFTSSDNLEETVSKYCSCYATTLQWRSRKCSSNHQIDAVASLVSTSQALMCRCKNKLSYCPLKLHHSCPYVGLVEICISLFFCTFLVSTVFAPWSNKLMAWPCTFTGLQWMTISVIRFAQCCLHPSSTMLRAGLVVPLAAIRESHPVTRENYHMRAYDKCVLNCQVAHATTIRLTFPWSADSESRDREVAIQIPPRFINDDAKAPRSLFTVGFKVDLIVPFARLRSTNLSH